MKVVTKKKFSFIINITVFSLCLLFLIVPFILPYIKNINGYISINYTFTLVAIAICSLIVLCETISLMIDKLASYSTLLVSLFMIGFELTSYDGMNLYVHYGKDISNFSLLFSLLRTTFYFAFLLSIWLFYFETYLFNLTKKDYKIIIISFSTGLILSIISTCFKLEVLVFLFSLPFAIYLSKIAYESLIENQDKFNQIPYLAFSLIPIFLSIELMTGIKGMLEDSIFLINGLTSFLMIIATAVFICIYCYYIFVATRKAVKEEEMNKEVINLQESILHNQIGPHFFFNSLELIKNLYAENQERGEQGINLLSKVLRDYMDSNKKTMIDITEELENTTKFVEFQELKRGKINVIYNIESYDFKVPFLSIQPLVENAIKYSEIEKNKDGYIEISTLEDDNFYYVVVKDNGKGFNLKDVKNDSIALNNIKKRLNLLLNAELKIKSEVNKGTEISVIIPKGGKKP